MFDMHFHSNLSDGKNSPGEIIQEAKKRKLKLITLTDHDIISSKDFIEESNLVGIRSIHSTEISARDFDLDKSIHLTGYSLSFGEDIKDVLENTITKKQEVIKIQIEKLISLGFEGSYNGLVEFWRNKGKKIESLNKYNIGIYLFSINENKQKISNLMMGQEITPENFFIDFLKEGGKYFEVFGLRYGEVTNYEPNTKICGELAESNNAILSIAHPNFTFGKDGRTNLDFVKTFEILYEKGVNAIEINGYSDRKWIETIYVLKKRFNIILTAGSDNHAIGFNDNKHGNFGELNQNLTEIQKKEILEEFMKYFKIS